MITRMILFECEMNSNALFESSDVFVSSKMHEHKHNY